MDVWDEGVEVVKDTATKAHFAGAGTAIVTLALYWLGPSIGLGEVTQEEATGAFRDVGTMLVESVIAGVGTGGLTWLVTYFSPKNHPKG